MALIVRVPATSANLGPGFDSLGVALARHMVVRTSDRRDGPRVTTTGEGADLLATDEDNLVWRSLVQGCDALGHPVPDLRLESRNAIPLERGLGSSSAAIVAGLTLARALADEPIADDDLVEVATDIEGHPDNVAPAIVGGLVTAGRAPSGRLVVRRAQPAAGLVAVVAVPSVRSRTDESRGVLPEGLSTGDMVSQGARIAHVVGGLVGAWPLDAGLAGDCFHEPVRLAATPASRALVNAWRAAGVFAVLSGAGPSVAAIVERRPEVVAHAVEVARRAGVDSGIEVGVEVLDWDRRGAVVCSDDDGFPTG